MILFALSKVDQVGYLSDAPKLAVRRPLAGLGER
jgi:hypothetical protein